MTDIVSPIAAESESRYGKLNVLTCLVLIWFHIQAVAAFFTFTWTNLITAVVLYWIAGGWGISMGYHRLHTHRGFKTYKPLEYFLAICGTLTLEGGPIFWVATHRLHHQYSDETEDPHTPRVSGFWAHMGWILFGDAHHNDTARMGRYAPDLVKDPFYRWLTTYHWVPLTALGFTLLAIGGWGLVNWAIFLRVVARLARDLAGQLGDPPVGTPPVCHEGRFTEHLVGRAPHVRRGLAQQPPCPPDVGPPRSGLVRVRPDVDRAQTSSRRRPGVGHPRGQDQPNRRGGSRLISPRSQQPANSTLSDSRLVGVAPPFVLSLLDRVGRSPT